MVGILSQKWRKVVGAKTELLIQRQLEMITLEKIGCERR